MKTQRQIDTRSAALNEDEEPPLLLEDHEQDNQLHEMTSNDENEASIMDEMMAIAQQAKATKRKQQEKERNSKAFGSGLKKGFFNAAPKKTSKATASQTTGNQRLDVDDTKRRNERLQIVNASDSKKTANQSRDDSFVFPEVQAALESMNHLNPNEWMNEAFFEKISKHPNLLQALQNPRFTQAISDLQKDPKAAMLKYQKDEAVSTMLRDFLGFLGDHFEQLDKQMKQNEEPPSSPAVPAPPAIVDLDETRREAIANMPRSSSEEAQVQQILQRPELLEALSDASLMDSLRHAREDPRELHRLRTDPVLGAKLRLLVDAKLVSFA
ncbi:hypothetical protein Poli38472_007415 [Pythium oligandrum]|uniref:STI1 domain-containing protein n=1 Tax=Pythium oligandrum TaxID=41045 RepID=A0A8K1CRP7_PYTOL|nr:hypothetical protein Poli38472_007415 [Pythium oligandrum]|eukprot:TMW67743.1 hypothetical protein Poli38472_007415 [Pythium oligandrum]